MKWEMINSERFIAKQDGYVISVHPGGFCWMWDIIEKGEIIDSCACHPHLPTSELDAKVKGEKALNKLLKPNT